MMKPEITRYRSPRARVAVAYSTKDRTDLTRTTIRPLIDDPDIDLYWFDGSATEPGRQLPLSLCPDTAAICELHQGVTGGPDCAIVYALQTLRARSYELVILIENDVLVSDGWYAALRGSMIKAAAAGFSVGAASARVLAPRVLSFNDDYCLLLNSGAGFIALTPAALDIVLANYRTTHGEEIIRFFWAATGIDISVTHGVARNPQAADSLFDAILYVHGYVVSAPPVTFVHNIDPNNVAIFVAQQVVTPDGHHPARRNMITDPGQIRKVAYPFFRFQKALFSDRLLISCHQLMLGVGSTDRFLPVRADGSWRQRWSQGFGPFTLFGSGRISLAMHDSTVGLFLYTSDTGAEIRVSGPDGYCQTWPLGPEAIFELGLPTSVFRKHDAVLEVTGGQLGFVGITVNADVISCYANRQTGLDHLPP